MTTTVEVATLTDVTSPDEPSILGGWGERLAAARTAAGMTQVGLAAATDVTVITIQRWEAGTRRPSVFDQNKLADVLDVKVSDLFPRTDREATLEEELAELNLIVERLGRGCS